MDFLSCYEFLKTKFKKDTLRTIESIKEYDSLQLASSGSNDQEGYQIFTPTFIVRDMCEAVGKDIFDVNKTVLEPTSGDGAFTTYILKKRLEKAYEENNFLIDSLRAVSTIYSIEMDKELIEKQRNNIYTVLLLFIKEKTIDVPAGYLDIFKSIIASNFMWAMFNSENDFGGGLLGADIAYKMPDAEKGKQKPIDMRVWKIDESSIDFEDEGVDLW